MNSYKYASLNTLKKDKAFLSTVELGELFLYDVLLSYIYPRIFVCEDEFRSKYLFYEMESDGNTDTWLVSKTKELDYYDLVEKRKSIQSIYRVATKNHIFLISNTYGEKDIVVVSHDIDKWLKQLPLEDVFSEKKSFGY